MAATSKQTWDSVQVDGVETLFYWGRPVKENTDTDIYFPINENYYTMGNKLLSALEYALNNKTWDYIARINGSCYVDKKHLIQHVQTLPDNNLFAGAIVKGKDPDWIWGPAFILSKDVVQKLVENKAKIDNSKTEDVAISYLASSLGISFSDGKLASIDRSGDKWRLIGYGSESFEFANFDEFQKQGHFFYRCKQDLHREKDEFVMKELFRVL